MAYKHLTFVQHCQVLAHWKAGYLQDEVTKEIGVSKSTLLRELKRNTRWNGVYLPEQAHSNYKSRRKHTRKEKKFTVELKAMIREKLQLDWSPKQISEYGERHKIFSIKS